MIDNGYLFAKDNKRIFINTSLGCAGQCAYCYLPKMGYSNSSDNYRTISAQTIIEFIEKNKSTDSIQPILQHVIEDEIKNSQIKYEEKLTHRLKKLAPSYYISKMS